MTFTLLIPEHTEDLAPGGSSGCPTPRNVQSLPGCGPQQSVPEERAPALDRVGNQMIFNALSNPNHAVTLCARDQPYLSLLAILRNSRTVMAFFWMLYCVKSPDCPVTTCWMGAGMTSSSMSS